MFIIFIIISIFILHLAIYFIKSDNKRSIITTATAGDPKKYQSVEKEDKKEIVLHYNNKRYSSYDKRYLLIKVDGKSMEKFPHNIKNNSLVVVDTTIPLNDIKHNDSVLIKKTRANLKSWCYKLRPVDYVEDGTIYSLSNSEHKINDSDDKEGFTYSGKIILESEGYFL